MDHLLSTCCLCDLTSLGKNSAFPPNLRSNSFVASFSFSLAQDVSDLKLANSLSTFLTIAAFVSRSSGGWASAEADIFCISRSIWSGLFKRLLSPNFISTLTAMASRASCAYSNITLLFQRPVFRLEPLPSPALCTARHQYVEGECPVTSLPNNVFQDCTSSAFVTSSFDVVVAKSPPVLLSGLRG